MEDSYHPKSIENIKYWLLFSRNDENIYSVGSKDNDHYIKVSESQLEPTMNAINDMNGSMTYKYIKDKYGDIINISSLISCMKESGLLEGYTVDIKNEYEKLSLVLLDINVKKFFEKLAPITKYLFNSIITKLLIACIFLSTVLYFGQLTKYMTNPESYRIYSSDILNIAVYASIAFLSIMIHELFHGFVSTKYEVIPTRFSAVLYLYFTPVFYLKIPNLYTLKSNERINVWSAGIYANGLIFTINLILFLALDKPLFLLISIVNLSLIITNINPFLPLDGYFIISTFLKETNLRKNMFSLLKRKNISTNKRKISFYLYFFISLITLAWLLITQSIWIINLIKQSYISSNTVIEFLYNIRLILIFLFFIIVRKFLKKDKKG